MTAVPTDVARQPTTSAGIVRMRGRGHALTIDSSWREVADSAQRLIKRLA